MAIRMRVVNGITVACNAAKTKPKEGDVYIDDNQHYALSVKFCRDGMSDSVGAHNPHQDSEDDILMLKEEEEGEG